MKNFQTPRAFTCKNLLNLIVLAILFFLDTVNAQQETDYNIHGKITGTNAQGLPGIEIKTKIYGDNWPTPTDSMTLYTNTEGYYNTTFTGIEEKISIENVGEIRYNITNTPVIELQLNKTSDVEIKLFNILGEEILTLLNEETKQRIIKADISDLSSGIYVIQTKINGKQYHNKLLKTEQSYNYGKIREQITEITKNLLEKKFTEQLYYGFNIRDPNGKYYTQHEQEWNLWELNSTNIEHNIPLLEKKQLDIPFNNPRNGAPVTNTRELAFYMLGCDVLPGELVVIHNRKKPYLIYKGLPELPPYYSQQDIDSATNYMMSITNIQKKLLWTETNIYIDPFDTINFVVDYLYLTNQELNGNDIRITFFIDARFPQGWLAGLWLSFNKETIEPQYIRKAVQLGWQLGMAGGMEITIPTPNAHAQNLRNGIDTLTTDEKIVYNYTMQVEKFTWFGPIIIIDEQKNFSTENFKPPDYTARQKEIINMYIKFDKDKTIIEKETKKID